MKRANSGVIRSGVCVLGLFVQPNIFTRLTPVDVCQSPHDWRPTVQHSAVYDGEMMSSFH